MADSESGPVSTEMEVSSLLPSSDAKDGAPPSTPSSISTEPSIVAEPQATAAAPTSVSASAEDSSTNEINIPSDEESDGQEWLKQESLVEPDESDLLEDDKIRAEQEQREAALAETRRKQEEVAKKMAEVEAKLKISKEDTPFDEGDQPLAEVGTNERAETTDETVTEEVAVQKDQEETNLEKEEVEESSQSASPLKSEPDAVENDTEDSSEDRDEFVMKEVAVQEDQEQNILGEEDEVEESSQSASPSKPKPEAVENDTKDSVDNIDEAVTAEVFAENDQEAAVVEDEGIEESSQSASPSKTELNAVENGTKDSTENPGDVVTEEVAVEVNQDEIPGLVEEDEEFSQGASPSNLESNELENDAKDSTENLDETVTEKVHVDVNQEETAVEEEHVEDVSASASSLKPEPNALENDTKNSTENSGESVGREDATKDNQEEIVVEEEKVEETLQNKSPSKSETVILKNDTEDSNENINEAAGEEVAVEDDQEENAVEQGKVEESSQKESSSEPELDTEGRGTNESDEKNRATSLRVEVAVPNDDDQANVSNKEEISPVVKVTPRSGGVSFAQAFSSTPLPPMTSPSLASHAETPTNTSHTSSSHQESLTPDNETPTSHSALSASKNKKASGLIFKYQEKVAHEILPGDSVPIRSISKKGNSYSDVSPGTARILQKKAAETFVELNSLPDMNSVRAKFEKSAKKSASNFEFGESFRQKQRHEQLSEKEKEEEAVVTMRGFNEKILNEGRSATGEIDTSNLPKSFTFDTNGPIMPNDGVCRVDYTKANFRAKIFIVHQTRGMLLLKDKHTSSPKTSSKKSRRKKTVPGGKIREEEFLAAAKESGSPQVQLQIAAREAAARYVYETTGLDIRDQADRLKPAVLSMNPSMNAARGYQYLRNENEEQIYYFLQVDETDFEKLKDVQVDDGAPAKLTRPSADSGDGAPAKLTRSSVDSGDDRVPTKSTRPSVDSGDDPLPLKLSSDYSGFEFVKDPMVASKVLKKDGNDAAIALAMIMNAAAQEMNGNGPAASQDKAIKDPDSKATEYEKKSMLDDELDDDEIEKDGTIRIIGTSEDTAGKPTKSGDAKKFYDEEAKLNIKTSADTDDGMMSVSCCCGFW